MTLNTTQPDFTDHFTKVAERLRAAGFVPAAPPVDLQQQLPMSQEDRARFGVQPPQAGLPADWDYRTAQLGPTGQARLQGQVGWTPDGERYFGGNSGLANWWNGLFYRTRAPIEIEDDEGKRSVAFDDASFWKRLTTVTGRATGEVVKGVTSALPELAEEVEQIRGGIRAVAESAGYKPDPFTGWMYTTDWNPNDIRIFGVDPINWVRHLINALPLGPEMTFVAGAAIRGFVQDPTAAIKTFGEGYEAGRILYSTLGDPARRAEYDRRLRAGENPWLLAEELQDPKKEFWGEFVADPLNFAGLITKPIRDAGMVRNIRRTLATPVDDLARVINEGSKAANTADAARHTTALVDGIVQYSQKMARGLGQASGWGFTQLLPESRRVLAAQKTVGVFGNILAGVVDNPQKIDDAVDALRGLTALHGTADEVVEGLAKLEHAGLGLNIALSEGGMEAGYILRRLLGDNPSGFIDEIRKAASAEDLLGLLGKGLDEAINAIYPSSKALRGPVGVATRIVESRFYKANRSLFGSLYMGYNPGFAARAMMTDTLHIFADTGIQGATDALRIGMPKAQTNIMRRFGFMPTAAAEGFASGAGEQIGGFASQWASKFQSRGSMISFNHFAERAFEMGYDTIARTTFAELKSAGASDEMLRLMRRGMDEFNDPAQLVSHIKDTFRKGYVEGSEMLWLDDAHYGMLKDYNLLDDYRSAMRGSSTLDDALQAHNRIFDSLEQQAFEAGKIPTSLAPADDLARQAERTGQAASSGLVAPNTQSLVNIQQVSNREVETLFTEDIFTEARRIAPRLGINDLDQRIPADLRVFTDGSWLQQQADQFRLRFSDPLFAVYKDLERQAATADVSDYWRRFGFTGAPPPNVSKDTLMRYYWENGYYPTTRQYFRNVREEFVEGAQRAVDSLKELDPRLVSQSAVAKLEEALKSARAWDTAAITRDGRMVLNNNVDDVRRLAVLNNIPTATAQGVPTRQLLNTINKYLPEGVERFADEALVPYEVAEQALRNKFGDAFVPLAERLGLMERPALGDLIPPISRFSDATITPSRMLAEQLPGIRGLRSQMEDLLRQNWSRPSATTGNPQLDQALDAWAKAARSQFLETRLVAERVGAAGRDLTVLPYSTGRIGIDAILAVIYPYHFWHSRTYLNWAKRIATNPELIAAYAKYRDMMAEVNAGLPEWWKYNLRVDDILGVPLDNPLFFNLEANLNPMNGLVGVDFDDPYKRVDWWTRTLDDISKWGPSPWTFLSLATAMSLHARGEDEAAARWANRLIPQTRVLQSATAMLGIGPGEVNILGIDPFESDPAISLFAGGIDPYVRQSGIPRALSQMVLDGEITQDQAIDAANVQEGEIWSRAYQIAVTQRAPGQLASYFFGTGFRARNAGDLQADQYFGERDRLYAMRDILSPDAFRQQMDELKLRYPFADALEISRKAGDQKDTALTYQVLSRIPPGESSMAQLTGIDPALVNRFYDQKGSWEGWTEAERMQFMGGVVRLSAVLATPSDATRAEWSQVRTQRSAVRDQMKRIYGADILDEIDAWYAAREQNPDVRPNQRVSQAMLYERQAVANNPLLASYYGGIDAIVRYHESLMYAEMDAKYPSARDKQNTYWELATNQRAAFLRSNPDLRAYWRLRDQWRARIEKDLVSFGRMLPDKKTAEFRPEAPLEVTQEFTNLETPTVNWPQALADLGDTALRAIRSALAAGEPLSSTARSRLQQAADNQGVSLYYLLFQLRAQYGY